jgi:hypothetical protein
LFGGCSCQGKAGASRHVPPSRCVWPQTTRDRSYRGIDCMKPELR